MLVADREGILRHISGNTAATAASIRQLLTVRPPAISLANTALDFGENVPAGESRTRTLVVQNTGGKELSISDIQSDLSGVTFSQTELTVAAGGSATIEITFTPAAGGPFSGTITISSDDPENGTVTVSLTGSAVIIRPPAINFANASLNFGEGIPAGESRTRTLVVQNTGGKELSITNIQSDLSGVTFSQTELKVAAGSSVTVAITFTPAGGGPFSGTITLSSNDPDNRTVTVSFSGTAVVIRPPTISLANTSLDFGEDVPVDESRTLTLVVKNTGDRDLSITGMKSDLDGVTFSVTEISVATGDSATVDITFTPAGDGPFSGTITISSNDPDNRTVTVSFSGIAVIVQPPTINVPVTTLDFGGDVPVNESRTLTLVVKNTGDEELSITGMESDLEGVTIGMTEFMVAADDSASIDITFTPVERGPFSGTITIISNDPENESITVSISGTVIVVDIVARADFDNDGEVGFSDFVAFARVFNTDNPTFDLDGNGLVDFPDFLEFARNFGKSVS